ncbi:hypothetical protein GGI23_007075 [Coemansia sp. RSA 2559]|nr:hypothetical protein GGI23_007075 [Coemansia sp. RSA 2559]
MDARLKHYVFSDDGQLLTFPRLKRLDLYVYDGNEEFEMMDMPVAHPPFPELQRLGLSPSYFIADDTLFKNTSGTLKHLTISIDRKIVDILQKHKVFSKGKYSQIRHITVGETYKPNLKLPADDFMKFAFGLVVPATRTLSITSEVACQPLVDAIPTCLNAKNIQVLTLRASLFNLLEALNIIRCLPNMTHFVSRFTGIGPELRGIQQGGTIPGSLYADYYPLSHRFKYWDIVSTRNIPTEGMALSAITLAILCPSFICLDVPCNTKKYDNKLRSALDSGLYDEHAGKIKRLFYHDHFSVDR